MMRYIQFIQILILFCLLAMQTSGQSLDSLDNAQQSYTQADYDSAIQFFELTVSGGIYNGDILYNLGNTYYHQGSLGQALLNYQRAMLFIPRDLDLNIQVARVRSLRSTLQTEVTHPLILIEQATSQVFIITELSILTFILWCVTWISIILIQIKKSWRRKFIVAVGVLCVACVSMIVLLGARLYIYHQMPSAVITKSSTPVYSGASISYFKQYDLSEASEIYITETQEGWYKFVTADNRQGWVEAEAVSLISFK